MSKKSEQPAGSHVSKSAREVINQQPPRLTPLIDNEKERLAIAYQRALIAEQDQRAKTNVEIAQLRKCERQLQSAAREFADYDQGRLFKDLARK